MEKEKELLKLQEDLKKLRQDNYDIAMVYGSELCAGDMFNQEKILEDKIIKLEKELNGLL
jgi:hypothetical protein